MVRRESLRERTPPIRAWLIDSEPTSNSAKYHKPPERNKISSGFALIILATLSRAFSTPSLATTLKYPEQSYTAHTYDKKTDFQST